MLRAIRRGLLLALLAAFTVAIYDIVVSVAGSSTPVGGFAWMRSLEAAAGLYGIVGIGFGLALGLWQGAIARSFGEDWGKAAWARLRQDEALDRRFATWLVIGVVALVLTAALVFAFQLAVALEMARHRNAALSTALVAMLATPIAFVALAGAFPLVHAVLRILPRPRVLWLAALGAAAIVGAVVFALSLVDWRVLDFGPGKSGLGFVAAVVVFSALSSQKALAGVAERVKTLAALSLVAAALLAFGVTWATFGDEPRSLSLVSGETRGLKVILRIARRFVDHDHDGYAARLGGGDCNDNDPAVNPGASDVPGDGIDQDCDGVDPKPLSPRPIERQSDSAQKLKWNGNFIFITVDTLRADRLNEKTMPRTYALAQKASVFRNAFAQAPNTPRSFPSFLTSRFPSEVRWARPFGNFSPLLDVPENTTFFQALAQAGWTNYGFFSSFYTVPKMGIGRGFKVWNNDGALSLLDGNTDIPSPRITQKVVAEIARLGKEKSGERFVIWTHLFDPHSKYMDHAEYPAHGSGFKLLEEKYNGEVFFVDLHIGKILDALAKAGLDQNTAVVIFADHGEAFGEHKLGGERMFFHGETIYDELLRVPLVVYVPGQAPRVVDDRVMLVDLGPTVLDLAKVDRPRSFRGRSLLPAMLGDKLGDYPAYAELLPAPSWNHRWRSIAFGQWKLIHRVSDNTFELYDVAADPTEQQNLAATDSEALAKMRQLLASFSVSIPAKSAEGPPTDVEPDGESQKP